MIFPLTVDFFFGTFAFFEKQFGSLLYFAGVFGNKLGHNRFVRLFTGHKEQTEPFSEGPSEFDPVDSFTAGLRLPGFRQDKFQPGGGISVFPGFLAGFRVKPSTRR